MTISKTHPTTIKNCKCLVIGVGVSGLVTAKELLEVGIEEVTILEKNESLGGVWQTHAWASATLTSSFTFSSPGTWKH